MVTRKTMHWTDSSPLPSIHPVTPHPPKRNHLMKRLGQWLSLLGLLSIGALATAQENYPSRVISIMVPYAAGAASDFTARALNDLIARQVGGQAIVENLPGASGAIAANKVLAAPAD